MRSWTVMIEYKYKIKRSTQFKRDYKLIRKRNYGVELLQDAIRILAKGDPLPKQYKDHALKGKFAGLRECHITSDWLEDCAALQSSRQSMICFEILTKLMNRRLFRRLAIIITATERVLTGWKSNRKTGVAFTH